MKNKDHIFGIRADWKALTFCILAAATFWLLNALNQDYTDTISYPFTIEYDEEVIVPLNPPPKKLKINVTAYGWVMLRKHLGINSEPIVYHLERLPRKEYITASQLTPLVVRQLTDLKINYLITDTLFFDFDKLKRKKIRIVVDTSKLNLASSWYLVSPIQISPDTLFVEGPASLIKELADSIIIEPSGEEIRGDYEESIKISETSFDKRINLLNRDVKIRFTAAKFEKESVGITARTARFPEDTSIYTFDRKLILTYFVKEEDKGKVKPEDFTVVLDYRRLDKKDYTIVPRLVRKPSFIRDYYFTPYAVRIRKKE